VKKVLIACTAFAALGLALAASRNDGVSVTTRIDNAIHDLEKVATPIPHEALHAKALEILRGRTVAQDDSQMARDLGADDLARIENCVAFSKTAMDKTTCK
jgi:hypothetical protein